MIIIIIIFLRQSTTLIPVEHLLISPPLWNASETDDYLLIQISIYSGI